MLRVSESQAKLLFGSRPKSPRGPRVKRRKEETGENVVEQQILDFLRVRGWLVSRQMVGVFVAYHNYANGVKNAPVVRVGERGASDWVAMRPLIGHPVNAVELFYLEIKAPGRKLRPEQKEWLYKRTALGFEADWFDCFDSGRRPFLPWYRERFGER